MAGLLDSLFAPSNYSGSQTGLLDFLRSPLMQYQQPAPGPGMAPTVVPQMPPAQDVAPPPPVAQLRQIPPNTVMQADQPQAPQQDSYTSLPALGGGGYLNRLENGGSLIGSLFGDSARQQNARSQYEATRDTLINNGYKPQEASSAAFLSVMNPEAAKTVLPEMLTNKEKWGVVGEDAFGNKQYGFVNERNQTVNGQPLGTGGSNQAGSFDQLTDKIIAARNAGASREQLLQMVPSGFRDDLDALANYKSIPANLGRAQVRAKLITLAHAINPNFDETILPTAIQMRKDFAGEGKNGQAIGALNTVQHHADQVSDAIEEYVKAGGGSDYPLLNAGKLMLANNTSLNPALRNAAQKLQDKLNATEHEVASAYNAGHITDSDRKTWNEIKAANLPADQLRQKLADFVDLLDGKRESLNHMYRNVFGTDAPSIDKRANDSATAKIHSRSPDYQGTAQTAAPQVQEGMTATNPQTGQKIVFKGGQWMPLQ